ncbi:MAG: hypothetical protein J6X55_10530 [Victivallales bacterium]|nr:hypothetical protein [Victivallales bacterium]
MMVKLLLFFCIVASILSAQQNLLHNPTGDNNFKEFFKVKGSNIKSVDGIISCRGNSDASINAYQKIQQHITPADKKSQNKTFILSFKARSPKLVGKCQVAVREAWDKDKSTYHGFQFRRFDITPEWRDYSKEFTTHDTTTDLSFYLVASYMSEDSLFEVKDIIITQK